MEVDPVSGVAGAKENLEYWERSYADDIARGRDPSDFGMRWMSAQIETWRKVVANIENPK